VIELDVGNGELPEGPLKEFLGYFKTLPGWLSVAPAAVAAGDSFLRLLPVSSAIRPWVYLLIAMQISYAIWSEAARYAGPPLTSESPLVSSMARRARTYIIGAFIAVGAYWIGTGVLDESSPDSVLWRNLELFGVALAFSFIFGATTRCFVILALKVKITTVR
jgi:hypothetical protein